MKLWMIQGGYTVIIVRAETEAAARQMVGMSKNDEPSPEEWLRPESYSCVELTVSGEPEIILDFEA